MIRTKLVIEIQLIIKKFPVGSLLSSWFFVITDLQVQRGSNKKAGKKFHNILKEMVKQPEDQFDEQSYYISTNFVTETVNLIPFVVS